MPVADYRAGRPHELGNTADFVALTETKIEVLIAATFSETLLPWSSDHPNTDDHR